MEVPSPLDPLDPNVTRHSPRKSRAEEKLLPGPPITTDYTRINIPNSAMPTESSDSVPLAGRPPLIGQPSYLRGRKRVIWRNKACYIALPPENDGGQATNRLDYMKPEDVAERLKSWQEKGFDTSGFVLASPSWSAKPFVFQGQTRSVHPDASDEDHQRQNDGYRVSIPDRKEWESYVNHLKEAKLRALGVTFGDGEAQSRKSPAPSLMSRQASSQSSGVLTSPPLNASSVPSNPYGPAYQPASVPVIKPGVSHFPRYSVALPFGEKAHPFAGQLPISHSPAHRAISPLGYMSSQTSSRIASPGIAEQLSSMPKALLSSAANRLPNGIAKSPPREPRDIENTHAQLLPRADSEHSHSQHDTVSARSATSKDPPKLEDGSLAASKVDHQANIVTPIPRLHQQNPSESLQREVEEAEAYMEEIDGKVDAGDRVQADEGISGLSAEAIRPQLAQNEVNQISSELNASPGLSVKSSSRHGSKSSVSSKFNANAPEFKFEPKPSLIPDVFAFLPKQQYGQNGVISGAQSTLLGPHARKASHARPLAKLNAAAPTFTPGAAMSKPNVPSRVFSFGKANEPNGPDGNVNGDSQEFKFSANATSLNPDAPNFTPSQEAVADHSKPDTTQPAIERIFGNVSFPSVIKPSKESKALPIINPHTDNESGEDSDGAEDESGRITQSDARQKRLRRDKDDGNQVPQFAIPPVRMEQHPQNSRAVPAYRPPFLRDQRRSVSLEAATSMLEEIVDHMSASESSSARNGSHPFQEQHSAHESSESPKTSSSEPLGVAESHIRHTSIGIDQANEIGPAEAVQRYEAHTQSPTNPEYSLNGYTRHPSVSSVSSAYSEIQDGHTVRPRQAQAYLETTQLRQDVLDGMRHVEPSFHELDDVIKHLNPAGDSDIGIVREATPLGHSSHDLTRGRSQRQDLQETVARKLLPPANLRSDAPSPSPNRLKEPFQYLPPSDDTESNNSDAARLVAQSARYSPSYRPSKDSPPVYRLNSPGSTPPSDWNEGFSSVDETSMRSRTGFFDQKVNEVVGKTIQQHLEPFGKMLATIQNSLTRPPERSTGRKGSGRPRSSGTVDIVNSDADDEDEIGDISNAKLRSPLRDRKFEQLQTSIGEIALAQQNNVSSSQLGEFLSTLNDLKINMAQAPQVANQGADMKTIVEEAVNRQMRGKSAPVISSSQAAAAEKSQLQIAGLESMLKIAEGRAEDEMKARRATEDALADNQRLLRGAMQEAAQQRESVEAIEAKLQEFHEERQQQIRHTASLEGSHDIVQNANSDLTEKNRALESTLSEYRMSHDQWRTNIDDVKHENAHLQRKLHSLGIDHEKVREDKEGLRQQLLSIQAQLSSASQDVDADRTQWRNRSTQHKDKLELLSARLEAEARTRERLELEIERLEAQEKDSMRARFHTEQTQKANAHFDRLTGQLRSEVLEHQKSIAHLQREHHVAQETAGFDAQQVRATADMDIKAARSHVDSVRGELQAIISSLERRLEEAAHDASADRVRHEEALKGALDSSQTVLRQAATLHEQALEDQGRSHARELEQLKSHHHHAIEVHQEDKHRLEAHLSAQLQFADQRNAHIQDRVIHLEEKLEIAKSAAHAAAQAAKASKTAVNTPIADAVPVSQSEMPEKISPQALRESILVLQEQLQARESTIEGLESKLAATDTKAPEKLKEAEVEISWLRELLGVRVDDLQDIINTLSQPSFQKEAVRDAAIRLRSNLQMEQQEKERAHANSQTFPLLTNITTLTTTPRKFAADAWSNWRRRGEMGYGNISAMVDERFTQTPSKSSVSPHSGLSGLLTPPSTKLRATPQMLGAGPRPDFSSNKFPQRSSTPDGRMHSTSAMAKDPATPPLLRKGSYDLDAAEAAVFGEEHVIEQERSGYNKNQHEVAAQEEPFGPRLGTFMGQ